MDSTRREKHPLLTVKNLGPIKEADLAFADLTVLVGPQGTGKSVLLQTLKLLIDRDSVHDTLKRYGVQLGSAPSFFEGYFGRGMAKIWDEKSNITWQSRQVNLRSFTKPSKSRKRYERLFYIPAQRVMSLPGGMSQNFGQFNYGDPYVLRAFSDAVHSLIQNEFGARGDLFPASNRLNDTLRSPISEHLFGGNKIVVDEKDFTKRLGLRVPGEDTALGFLSWSAGQREFAPMLLGIYWLCTVTQKRRSGAAGTETIDWVVIEEPEMGLHPHGTSAVLLLVLELLRRGYRVVVSTHSAVVLEMIWALQVFKELRATESDVRKLFELPSSNAAKELGAIALKKDYRVFYFDRRGKVKDISALSPEVEDTSIADWGGISGFSSRAHRVIADAVVQAELRSMRRKVQEPTHA